MDMKLQASMEFIALFMILLLALVVISTVSYTQLHSVDRYQTDLEVEKVMNELVLKLNTAFLQGDGYFTNVTLPEKIIGAEYTIEINQNQLILEVESSSYTKTILTNNIQGDPVPGHNNNIENQGGLLKIT